MARSPQVRRKTSGSTSMAMSQRTPSQRAATRRELTRHRLAQAGVEVVELHGVRPAREVRIAPVGQHAPVSAERAGPVGGLPGEVVLGPLDEELRMRLHPRMIRRDVVGDEVEEEPEAAPGGPRRGGAPAPRRRRTPEETS